MGLAVEPARPRFRGEGPRPLVRLKLWHDLRAEGVAIRSVTDDEPSAATNCSSRVASQMAHKFAEDLSGNTRRGVRQTVTYGRWGGGRVPDGFWPERVMDGKRARTVLDLDPERAPVVSRCSRSGCRGMAAARSPGC